MRNMLGAGSACRRATSLSARPSGAPASVSSTASALVTLAVTYCVLPSSRLRLGTRTLLARDGRPFHLDARKPSVGFSPHSKIDGAPEVIGSPGDDRVPPRPCGAARPPIRRAAHAGLPAVLRLEPGRDDRGQHR